jgi:hypothetical protein
MKVCSYCGKEHPDDALACTLDGNSLIPANLSHPEKSGSGTPLNGTRILSIAGFSVLSGLCGVGVAYFLLYIIAVLIHGSGKKRDVINFFADHVYCLPIGGILGLIAGLIISLNFNKQNLAVQERVEKKYVGGTGRLKIYLGAPAFISGLIIISFNKLLHFEDGKGPYLGLGICLAIVALSLFVYDRIPAKLIIPIGIVGWLLIVAYAVWFGFRTSLR